MDGVQLATSFLYDDVHASTETDDLVGRKIEKKNGASPLRVILLLTSSRKMYKLVVDGHGRRLMPRPITPFHLSLCYS